MEQKKREREEGCRRGGERDREKEKNKREKGGEREAGGRRGKKNIIVRGREIQMRINKKEKVNAYIYILVFAQPRYFL